MTTVRGWCGRTRRSTSRAASESAEPQRPRLTILRSGKYLPASQSTIVELPTKTICPFGGGASRSAASYALTSFSNRTAVSWAAAGAAISSAASASEVIPTRDRVPSVVRYLVTARVKAGRREPLRRAIDEGTLGAGSIAGDEYFHNMAQARELPDGRVKWVETCFCATPLAEERSYWEEFFALVSVKDAHARSRCRHDTGEQYWACSGCDCTKRLEEVLERTGRTFDPRRSG